MCDLVAVKQQEYTLHYHCTHIYGQLKKDDRFSRKVRVEENMRTANPGKTTLNKMSKSKVAPGLNPSRYVAASAKSRGSGDAGGNLFTGRHWHVCHLQK